MSSATVFTVPVVLDLPVVVVTAPVVSDAAPVVSAALAAPAASTALAVPARPAPNVDAATKPAISLVRNPIPLILIN